MLKVSEKSNRAALESGFCTSNTHDLSTTWVK